MFNLTHQEKAVILFLAGMAVVGVGASYCLKNIGLSVTAGAVREPPLLERKENKKININQAGMEELVSVHGIGKEYAKRIIEYRDSYGAFIFIEDLKQVKGIGPVKFEKIKEHIVVE